MKRILILAIIGVAGLTLSVRAQTWTNIGTFDSYISFVKFFDANTGFVGTGVSSGKGVTGPVEIEKTTDGGKTWVRAKIPGGYTGEIGDIIMVDALTGWCAMTIDRNGNGTGRCALWRTTDGGLNWNETSLQGAGTSVRITPKAMVVTDILGNGHISTDGGNTFSDAPFHSTNCADFADPMNGVISEYRGQNWLYSHDGGLTWNTSDMTTEAWSVYADSGTSNFYAAPEGSNESSGIIYRSTDYGETWNSVANFPFVFTGHLAGIGGNYLFFQVNWGGNTIGNITYDGFYYSTDQGVNWTSIGGPPALNDTRFSVLDECAGITVYGFDSAAHGSVYKYSFGTGIGQASLLLPETSQHLVVSSCSQPADTAVPIALGGCATSKATLDSLWITGSSAFTISDTSAIPRLLAANDSILVSYSGAHQSDTATLHIQYDVGSGEQDTSIMLIGTVTSPFFGSPVQLDRSSASAYYGQLDSLTLGVDITAQVNLDSLWPYLNDIRATYSWDSSVASYAGYIPPSGWAITSLVSRGDELDFEIQNGSSSATHPLDLGMALFRPHTTQLASSWVVFPRLIMDVGGQALSLCVTENEDSHWSIKTLGTLSGVVLPDSLPAIDDIAIYPNPAGDKVFVQNPYASSILFTMYDALGKVVSTGSVLPASTSSIDMQSILRGSYLLVFHTGGQTIVRRISKVQ